MMVIFKFMVMILVLAGGAHAATPGQIIVGDDIAGYPPEIFSDELSVFGSVGEGIQVIMAVCQDQPDCTFAISDSEIAKLIETLDNRIDQLDSIRQEGPIYGELLEEYRDMRSQYAMYRREIEDITRAIEEGTFYAEEPIPDFEQDVYEDDIFAAPREPRYRHEGLTLDMFEDIDEPLPFE